MGRRHSSDVEGQTERTLEMWAKTHPMEDDGRRKPPRDFNVKPIVAVVGALALVIVSVCLWRSRTEDVREDDVKRQEAEAQESKAKKERERAAEARRQAAEARRRAAEEAARQKQLMMTRRAEQTARLKREQEAAQAARREKELAAKQAAQKVEAERAAVEAKLSRLRRSFEIAGRIDDPYVLYGVAQYYYGRSNDDDMSRAAKEGLATAAYAVQKDRTKYPAMKHSAPVEMDRVVLKDGTSVVGRIVGRSPASVIVDVTLTADDGSDQKTLNAALVRSFGTTRVDPERVNRRALACLCRDLLAKGRSGRHADFLGCWGTLCLEFPDEDAARVVAGAMKGGGEEEQLAVVERWVSEAVGWTALACPRCLGAKTVGCEQCGGKGKVSREVVCPRCKGEKVDCPACPTPHPWEHTGPVIVPDAGGSLPTVIRVGPPPGYKYRGIPGTVRCPYCNGTGRLASKSVGPFRLSNICGRCGGTGERRCPKRCADGFLVCPLCKNKLKVTVEESCPVCKGTKGVPCPECLGSGLRRDE